MILQITLTLSFLPFVEMDKYEKSETSQIDTRRHGKFEWFYTYE